MYIYMVEYNKIGSDLCTSLLATGQSQGRQGNKKIALQPLIAS